MSVAVHPNPSHGPQGAAVETEHGHEHDNGSLYVLGFWLFIIQDLILFSCLFATYLVMQGRTAGGPTPKELFDVPGFSWETFLLLTSSFTCGLATFQLRRGKAASTIGWLVVTVLLGLGFVGLEANEFVTNALEGATMQRSGFLSAFYTLVGTHGCHVSLGIGWVILLMIQLARRGVTPVTFRKVFIWSIYWHFLDIVWVFIYTAVYLNGLAR
ncbi:MAG: cytochrome (ubi)quinol oxidase subunit III [Thermoflavifilum sp.]|nr:cytochrome (ubi)quinol oxidase subunit III [Thermoflavifilum sp.]MCL6512868.1 cytochrome (ubi)quinol oxidase subunit III [Alicyclobacillus sp.]